MTCVVFVVYHCCRDNNSIQATSYTTIYYYSVVICGLTLVGAAMRAAKRIQINLQLHRNKNFIDIENIMPQVHTHRHTHILYMYMYILSFPL